MRHASETDGWATLYVIKTHWGGTVLVQKHPDGCTRTVVVR